MTISRIDQKKKNQHGWWVRYFEYGEKRPSAQKFFADKRYHGREFAYIEAKHYEDYLKKKFNWENRPKPEGSPNPHIRSPKTKNKANKTGVLGVQRSVRIRPNGNVYESYVASYPIAPGKTKLHVFSINKFGERVAFRLAIMARILGLANYYDPRYRLALQALSDQSDEDEAEAEVLPEMVCPITNTSKKKGKSAEGKRKSTKGD